MRKKVVVTGATGFVGNSLTRKLIQKGYEVHVLTRNSSNKWRLKDIIRDVTEHEVDLKDEVRLQTIINLIKPEIIVHLATYGGYASQKDDKEIIQTNFNGTLNLLNACVKNGFDLFINTGSSSEYGIKQNSMSETDVIEPIGSYAISKSASTLLCQSMAIETRLPITTLRIFSPYGPNDDPKRFIPYMIKSLLNNESPNVSTPNSVRDYIYIDDVINAYTLLIEDPISQHEIINIGSGQQISIGEIAKMSTRIINNNVNVNWGAVQQTREEPLLWQANIDKAKRVINWVPKTNIESGLNQTINWMKENLQFYI